VSYLTPQSRATAFALILLLSFLIFPAIAAGHTVALSWDASTSQGVVGYNVYRGPAPSGPYTKLNATLDALTGYSDSSVQAGQTYYYVTTAVDSLGDESGYSNQTKAIIPNGGSGSESALYNFSGGTDPKSPYAGMVFDKAGNLYGTTQLGGANSMGTVFEMAHNPDGSWSESVLYSFTGSADGGQPSAGLIFDASGNLYGTTNFGGSGNCNQGCGTVFKLTPGSGGWTESVIYTFTGGSDGREPYARLLFDAAGNLYGTTLLGGNVNSVCSTGCGTVFKLARTSNGWTESVLYAFAGGTDGASPYAALAADSTGNLYGTTYGGGAYASGVIFKLSPASSGWTQSVIYAFTGSRDGKSPFGDIFLDAAGNLYGTAFQGGSRGYGVVIRLAPNPRGGWYARVLHSFANAPSANPVAGLVMDLAGNLYGTTLAGGKANSCGTACGTLFELSPVSGGGWSYQVVHVFGQGADGYHPSGDLILDAAGNMYGTTQAGGAQGAGLVFEIMH
jgi:uncharacterized repeat protein (TIGR03803 family)